jgi:hypothetical protein
MDSVGVHSLNDVVEAIVLPTKNRCILNSSAKLRTVRIATVYAVLLFVLWHACTTAYPSLWASDEARRY